MGTVRRDRVVDVVLGVDGGNSKTFALVADTEGHLLGFGQTGGSNHEGVGFSEAEERLHAASHAALSNAGVEGTAAVGFWGLAGADLPSDFERFDIIMPRIHAADRNVVKNDTMAVTGAGLTRGWGVGIISGAGFNAGGIAPDGREIQNRGMGYATGDWGGAWDIGPEMIRIAHRIEEGRERPSVLSGMVAEAMGLERMSDIALRVRSGTLDEEEIRRKLPPLLFEASYDGDEVACDLVVRVGQEIGVTANTIIKQLGLDRLDVEVVLGGSIFKGKGPLLLDTVRARVHRVAPRAQIIIPEFDPVIGAVFQALRYLGIDAGEQVRHNVRATLPPELL
jgi:N-acetylglucosamine kinase-like BadF-type ATPase